MADEGRMAYIDSELAKRRREEKDAAAGPGASIATIAAAAASASLSPAEREVVERERKKEEVERQPATIGKLLEIDLGDEVRDMNVERTNQARRRLDGETIEEEEERTKKVRLGRDGKPWRGKKRRGSEDIKRDKLVEDILRENRCKPYPLTPHTDTDLFYSGIVRRTTSRTGAG